MSAGRRVRAFLAVPPDPGWVESAAELVSRLRPSLPDASWTRPPSWHLTLKFLGEVSEEVLEAFLEGFAPLAAERQAGELAARGPVALPRRGAARVLGVGFADTAGLEEIRRLAADAERIARREGAEREDRPFRPHVTLARVRHPWPREAVASYEAAVGAWKFPAWPAGGCALYSSRLSPDGAVHTPIARWTFDRVPREAPE
ncbi:MAG: RNA 2',3'-cyclic phosphodiesterase [Thermoanaerobaculia bacterium]